MYRYVLTILATLLLASPALAGAAREHFGNDEQETGDLGVGAAWTYANCWSADYYTASTGDVVDSLWVWVRSPSASDDSMKIAIYDVADGQPENKLMESERFGVTSTGGWYGIAVNQALANGVTYTLACGEFFGAGTWYLYYEAQTDGGSENGSTFPDPWVSGNNNWRFSLYAVYTPGGEPVAPGAQVIIIRGQ